MSSNANGMHVGHQVMAMIDRLGVSPLVRNYQLFHTCITNSTDQKLRGAVRALGNSPTQAQVDALIELYLPEAMGSAFMRRQQDEMLRSLEGLLSRLDIDQMEVRSFTGAVNKVSESLSSQSESGSITPEKLVAVAEALAEAGRRKVAAGNKTITQVGSHVEEIAKMRDEINRLRMMANTDELTGLHNRRAFDETLASYFSSEDRGTFALVMIDIDHFKQINDTYGHAGGDKILCLVASCIRSAVRQDSFVARTGGEEFAVILRKTNTEDVAKAAERIRTAIADLEIASRNGGQQVRVTASVGVSMADMADNPPALYVMADSALYRSKNTGRNRVTISDGSGNDSGEKYLLYRRG